MAKTETKQNRQLHWPLMLRDLWRNAWLIVLAGVIGVLSVFAYTGLLHTPEYTSTVTFAVSPKNNGSYVGFYSALSTAGEMAEVFKEVFSSDILKRMVKEDMGDESLEFEVEATVEAGTNILKISLVADSPVTAHRLMESVLRNYPRVSEYLFGNVVLDTVKSPHIPTEQSNPVNLKLWCALASVGCMGLMAGGIFLLSLQRSTVKTLDGARRALGHAPVGVLVQEKGALPGKKRRIKGLLIWLNTVSFRYSEAILQVAHRLRRRMAEDHKKILLITSVAENEGKSTLAANLAIAMTKHGMRVALVDLDLRKPSLHKLFAETASCLSLNDAIAHGYTQDPDQQLLIFANPEGSRAPGELLHDPRLEQFLLQLRQDVDLVILDSAPYAAVADTGMLLNLAEGCLMAVRQDWVPVKMLQGVAEELDQGKADYLGYVINYYIDNGALRHHEYGKYKY